MDTEKIIEALTSAIASWGLKVVGVLVAIFIAWIIAGSVRSSMLRSFERREFDATLGTFFANLARYAILIAAVLGCLGVFGIETTSFAAILGAASLAVGLAFQGTLSNFSAGVMLLTFRPFKIGDFVVLSGKDGTVAEIGLFTTTLDTLDNRRVIIPNSEVIGTVIENYTHNEVRRVDIDVGVSYGADIDEARKVLDAAAAQVPGRDPEAGHQIFLVGLGASSVDFQVRIWCDPAIYWDVWDATVRASKKALDDAGISIPFPQMDVHLDKLEG